MTKQSPAREAKAIAVEADLLADYVGYGYYEPHASAEEFQKLARLVAELARLVQGSTGE